MKPIDRMMFLSRRSNLLAGVAFCAMACSPGLGSAQSLGSGLSAASGSPAKPIATEPAGVQPLDEVVVTARRRNENLLAVPVAVTAFTAKAIEQRNITSLIDAADYTPSLSITEANGSLGGRLNQNITIRGMTPSAGGSPNVSVFIDGAPVSFGLVSGVDDLARLEILDGPQSAYFGRETFAGAINLVTRTPANDYQGHVEAKAGNDALYDTRFSVEGPIVKDVLTARISARFFGEHGQYTNAADPGERLGDESTKSVNGEVNFKPINHLTFGLFGFYNEDYDGPTAQGKYTSAGYNYAAGAKGAALNYFRGTLPNSPTIPVQTAIPGADFDSIVLNNSTGKYTSLNGTGQVNILSPFINGPDLKNKEYHVHFTADYDFGWANFTSLTAFNRSDEELAADLTNEAGPPAQLAYVQARKQDWSQEFRLTSNQHQRFRWSIGGDYLEQLSAVVVEAELTGAPSPPYPLFLAFGTGNFNKVVTPAVFGSLAYDILPKLELDFEARYQVDEVSTKFRNGSFNQGATIEADHYDNFLPRVILNYKIQHEAALYASFPEGANPGTINASLTSATYTPAQLMQIETQTGAGFTVQPETLKDYEAGLKGRAFGGRLQGTADIYYSTWDNQIVTQTAFVNGSQIGVEGNIGASTLYGLELQGQFIVSPKLVLNGAFSYNHTKIDNYNCATCASAITGNPNVDGHRLPRAPLLDATVGGEYSDHAFGPYDYFGRADYIYKSGQYVDETNLVETEAQSRLNLRAGLRSEKIKFEAFVTNVFNNRAPSGALQSSDATRGGINTIYSELPVLRQEGVRLYYNF